MAESITIAGQHSVNNRPVNGPSITIPMIGGNPSIGFVWIDDVCYTLYKTQRGKVSLKKTT